VCDRLAVLSLCSGIGGLELGLRLAGVPARVVAYLEREAFACACLDAAIEAGALDDAPIWPDLTTLPGRQFAGKVDIITAGFPCQPWSCAGQRKGTDDERWIWPDIARIIREVGPRFVFLENVPGLLAAGLGHVLGDLAESGFDAEWDVFSAGAVGAGHKRQRLFILAYRRGERRQQESRCPHGHEAQDEGWPTEHDYEPPGNDEGMADANGDRLQGERLRGLLDGERTAQRDDPDGCDPEGEGVVHAEVQPEREQDDEASAIRQGGEARQEPCGRRDGIPPFPPGPSDAAAWRWVLERWPELAPAVADSPDGQLPQPGRGQEGRGGPRPAGEGHEQLDDAWGRGREQLDGSPQEPTGDGTQDGLPLPSGCCDGTREQEEAQPPLRRVADGLPSRVDQLRALGNGVVPVVAAYAFRTLAARFEV